jgi:quinoprotein glucose dehydrogenase
VLASLLHTAPKDVRLAATRAATALGMKEADLFALVADVTQSPEVHIEALRSLAEQKDPRLAAALKLASTDAIESVRIEAARLHGGATDIAMLAKTLESGTLAEKQSVLASLGNLPGEPADALVARQLDALLAGTLAKELELDVLEAAAKRPLLKPKVAAYEARSPKDDPLAVYRPALHGGNAENGKKVFIENQQIACFRCHKINGEGGDVGSDLTGLGATKGREYLLESIVQPNKQVAAGFENVLIEMKDGASYAGLVKSETGVELVLNSPEDGVMTLKKTDIKSRQRGLSAMPEELVTYLSKRELRDLIEFLATLK